MTLECRRVIVTSCALQNLAPARTPSSGRQAASTFDKIYALGAGLINVAEAKPTDTDFNGGRWAIYPITWIGAPVQFTNDTDILRAEQDGYLTISSTPVREFVCPVIHVPPSSN